MNGSDICQAFNLLIFVNFDMLYYPNFKFLFPKSFVSYQNYV